MDVTMNVVGRLVPVHHGEKCAETVVCGIRSIALTEGRGVCHQKIKAVMACDHRPQFQRAEEHLIFRVLVWAGLIAHGAAQAYDADAVLLEEISVYTDAPLRGSSSVGGIMVPVDIENRAMKKRGQKREILRIQVAAGEDQIDSLQAAFFKIVPESR